MTWTKIASSSSNGVNKWTGKKLLFIGDSITNSNESGGAYAKSYVSFIRDTIGATVVNNGISGSGFLVANPAYSRISALPTDCDLIGVFLGTNDWVNTGVPLGSFGDTGTTTFYGAVDTAFKNLWNQYPLKTIFVMTPLPRGGQNSVNGQQLLLKDYVDAIRKEAEKWSFPVLDLFAGSNFKPENFTFRQNYTSGSDGVTAGDTTHPNTAWHRDILTPRVLNFMNTL